jgi:hypothetical protein
MRRFLSHQNALKEYLSMEMQLYLLHVVPFIVIVYLAFLLFLRPPGEVILASLVGGLTMGVMNALVDLIAYYASIWHYSASGLILHLPLPLYITPILIFGGLVYLLIWRFWHTRAHWFALLLLVGVPIFGFVRDYFAATTLSSYVVWDSAFAWPVDLIMWLAIFYTGYFVFRRLAPARKNEIQNA